MNTHIIKMLLVVTVGLSQAQISLSEVAAKANVFKAEEKRNKKCIIVPLGGQSNMQGGSTYSGSIDEVDEYPVLNLFQISRGNNINGYNSPAGNDGDIIPAWQALQHNTKSKNSYNSVGFHTGQRIAKENPKLDVILVPFATGNTGFTSGNPTGAWSKGGPQRVDSVARLKMAATKAKELYGTVVCPAFIWHQGESDSNNLNTGFDYSRALMGLTDEWRGIDEIYADSFLISGDINNNSGYFNTYMRNHRLMDKKSAHVSLYGKEIVTKDKVHYDEKTVKGEFAERYFQKYQQIMAREIVVEELPNFTPSFTTGLERNYNFQDFSDSTGNGADLELYVRDNNILPVLSGGVAGFSEAVVQSDFSVREQNGVYGFMTAARFRENSTSAGLSCLMQIGKTTIFSSNDQMRIQTASGIVKINDFNPRDGEWHNIVVRLYHDNNSGANERQLGIYVNGTSVYETSDSPFGANIKTNTARIGGRFTSDINSTAQISNVLFYEGKYTAAQAEDLSSEIKKFFKD